MSAALSVRFQEAFKPALAMVIAYYISLSMGWDRPHWAGLAVPLCSLSTTGDSLNKGLLRILGSFLAGSVALLLIALFPQDRWSYLFGATLYIAFCTYMMGHSSRWYFWFIAGYVMPLLALAGGPEGATAFETVVLRIQQTIMGVTVFTLVSVLVWPQFAAPALKQTVANLADVQRRLLGHHFASLESRADDGEAQELRAEATGLAAQLPAIVDGAEFDGYEVWEMRHLWRRCAADFVALQEAMERWRQGFPELEEIDLARRMPGLPALGAEVEARLASVARMLAGHQPERWPAEVALDFDEVALNGTSAFDRAALVCSRGHLQEIERLTRGLFERTADICGFVPRRQSKDVAGGPTPSAWSAGWTIDLDRLATAVRSFTAVWLILLACLYIPDFPMPAGVIPVAAAVAIQLSLMPDFPLPALVLPVLGSVALAGAFHILVMPQLSGFLELGFGIFIAIFLICFVFAGPGGAMFRGIGTSMFVMVISVSDQQSYSFLFPINFALMFLLALSAVWVSTWFPISFLPQQVIFKQLGRFLWSVDQLATPPLTESGSWRRRMWLAFHVHEVTTLPRKIGRWMAAAPAAAHGTGTREQAQVLADRLQALSDRLRELVESRHAPQSRAVVQDLRTDIKVWRLAIQEIVRRLAVDPASVKAASLRSQLNAKLEALEARIESVLNGGPEGAASAAELDNMYRLLGAYRGVSEAVIDVAQQAEEIDWAHLGEARF